MPDQPFNVWLGSMFGESTAVDLDNDVIKARLVSDDDWAIDPTEPNMGGIPAYGGEVDQTLTGTSISGAVQKVFDADDAVFPLVAADGAKAVDTIVVFKDDGGQGVPISIHDLVVPVTPNGTDITVRWNVGGITTIQGA